MVERFLCLETIWNPIPRTTSRNCPNFHEQKEHSATAGGTSNNTNDNVTTSGISTAQGDVDALTTALDVASRSAQHLIPQLTQLSERVRSGDIFQSTQAASSSQERRDNNEQSVVNGEILEIARSNACYWRALDRVGARRVICRPCGLTGFCVSLLRVCIARPRNRTIPFMNSLRTALGGESAGNEQRNDEVGNGVYTECERIAKFPLTANGVLGSFNGPAFAARSFQRW